MAANSEKLRISKEQGRIALQVSLGTPNQPILASNREKNHLNLLGGRS